ncbi:MAG: hypothetical protein WC254_07600 [Candidatus Woesearchaeota archaeon]|jgi:5-bromo-4-chloroindolyl phosphate hydrolysis protein
MKKLYWILGIILSPVLLVIGLIFFSIVAVIIIAIAILIGLLAFVMYLNKKFKYLVFRIKNSSKNKENPEHKSNRTGKEHEVIIEQIEEHEQKPKTEE